MVSTFKQIGRLSVVRKFSCHNHTFELLQVTVFSEVFGVSVVTNDQYASLKLAEKRKKQLTEIPKNTKAEI